MTLFTGIVVFIIVWWMCLFIVLPIKIKRDKNNMAGNQVGAPEKANILWRFLATTLLACIFWVIIYFIQQNNLITFSS